MTMLQIKSPSGFYVTAVRGDGTGDLKHFWLLKSALGWLITQHAVHAILSVDGYANVSI
jgi:hypothetical protein